EPVYGWGGWGRNKLVDGEVIIIDGMWIAIFGTKGFIGLGLWYLVMILPSLLFMWHFPARLWRDPLMAPAAIAAVLLGIYTIDCLVNGFVNMLYVTAGGGLIVLRPPRRGLGPRKWISHSAAERIRLADQDRCLGRTLKEQGRWTEAQAAWQQALDLLTEL